VNPCYKALTNKIGYIGHRRFLPKYHTYRRSKLFKEKAEPRDPPRKYTQEELAEKLETVKDYVPGKNPAINKQKRPVVTDEPTWNLKASLHDLTYWSELKLAHNLDVLHIEKNICDNILGTLPELEGKNKDTVNARIDLEIMKFKKKLWMNDEGDIYRKPHAPWTLDKERKIRLCKFLGRTRFPDGYCSNWERCVDTVAGKVTGMKTHDWHILLQRILPSGLKGIALAKEMYQTIAELGRFFRDLCAKTVRKAVLKRYDVEIVIILCKIEKLFPLHFLM
jgi:hypothetical protein